MREERKSFHTGDFYNPPPPAAPAQQAGCYWPAEVHIASAVWKGRLQSLNQVVSAELHSLITGHYSGRVVASEWQMEEK